MEDSASLFQSLTSCISFDSSQVQQYKQRELKETHNKSNAILTMNNLSDASLLDRLLPSSSLDFFSSSSKSSNNNNNYSNISSSNNKTFDKNKSESSIEEELPNIKPLSTLEEVKTYRKQHKIKVRGISSDVNPDFLFTSAQNNENVSDNPYRPFTSFTELKQRYPTLVKDYLNKNLITKLKYKQPTPIQSQSIPIILSRKECLIAAPTGSGKTIAYCLPMLALLNKPKKEGFRGLIITPTRVLADQIFRILNVLSSGKEWKIKLNEDEDNFDNKKQQNNDILIATPAKLLTMIKSNKIDLSHVEMLVFDEADRLFDLGFIEQVDDIINHCNNHSLIKIYVSATIPLSLEHTLKTQSRLLNSDAIQISVGVKNASPDTIHQQVIFVGSEEGKLIALKERIRVEGLKPPVLIFVQSIERAKQLHQELFYTLTRTTINSSSSVDTGASDPLEYCVDYIHGKRSDKKNQEVIQNFRTGKTWALICTDVVARGIDFKNISCVINYDFPVSVTSYIHRIGRTGRAGQKGEAITFFTYHDLPLLKNIAIVLKKSGCPVPNYVDQLKTVSEEQMKKLAVKNASTNIGENNKKIDEKEKKSKMERIRDKLKRKNMASKSKSNNKEEAKGPTNKKLKKK
ncbi:hypothetical protein ABK040_006290 [Willaertia magna]